VKPCCQRSFSRHLATDNELTNKKFFLIRYTHGRAELQAERQAIDLEYHGHMKERYCVTTVQSAQWEEPAGKISRNIPHFTMYHMINISKMAGKHFRSADRVLITERRKHMPFPDKPVPYSLLSALSCVKMGIRERS